MFLNFNMILRYFITRVSFSSDHLCNLYGPTIITENAAEDVYIRHVPETDEDLLAVENTRNRKISRNSYAGSYLEGRELRTDVEQYKDDIDYAEVNNRPGGSSQVSTLPVIPPRRDLKPTDTRRPISGTYSFSRPLSSIFGGSYGSRKGSISGSIGSVSPSIYSPSTHSPYTPSMRQKGFNFVLDPSPPAIMTRKQSRDEIAMVRNALKQNAFTRVTFFKLIFTA